MESVFAQPGAGVRFEWGVSGAAELSRTCAVLVVCDVLSFTTAVCVAVERGMRVHPFPWGAQADAYAGRIGAVAAVGRTEISATRPWSLSPAALSRAPVVSDLVLPSPNGSAICAAAGSTGTRVVAACLRNASAVVAWLVASGYGDRFRPIGVIAAGERWPDGSIRPCVEDLAGAAAVLDGLSTVVDESVFSMEASVAALLGPTDLATAVRECVSGRELVGYGFTADVEIAAARDVSSLVPVLHQGAFTAVLGPD